MFKSRVCIAPNDEMQTRVAHREYIIISARVISASSIISRSKECTVLYCTVDIDLQYSNLLQYHKTESSHPRTRHSFCTGTMQKCTAKSPRLLATDTVGKAAWCIKLPSLR